MTSLNGTLYIDGGKDGAPVQVVLQPGSVRATTEDGNLFDLPLRGATYTKGGYNDGQLIIKARSDQGAEVTLYVNPLRDAARGILGFGTDRETEAALEGLLRRRRGLMVAGILAGAGVLAWLLYLLVSVVGVAAVDLAVDQVPVDMEEELGEQAATQTLGDGRVCTAPEMNQAVVAIMDRLTGASEDESYTFRFYVADAPDVNAFALPGGYVFVNRGLIEKAESPEEVAGVLAHEMTHVLERHGLRNVVARAGLWIIAGLVFGDVSGGGIIAGGASELLNLSFSRTQEEAADAGGLALLYAAEINPQGLPDFFEKLLEEEGELGAAIPSFMSSHPETRERIATIRAEIDRLGPRDWRPIDVDWDAAKAACAPTPSSDPTRTARDFAEATGE